MLYIFDNFILDTERKNLKKDGEYISRDDKVAKLLQTLIERFPTEVSKTELFEILWPNSVVSDSSLSRLIADVRQLLDDTGKEQKYIKTIHGRGFRFNLKIESQKPDITNKPIYETVKFKISTIALLSLTAAVILIILFLILSTIENEIPPKNSHSGIRIAVLPVQNFSRDTKHSWVNYGLMSVISEQLGSSKDTESVPAFKILDALKSMNIDANNIESFNRQQFELLCIKVACTHVISSSLRVEKFNPELSYTLFSKDSIKSGLSFRSTDILSATKLLLVDLSKHINNRTEINFDPDTAFTHDVIANRNYAIGKSDQLAGELSSAATFFELSLVRSPDFFLAKFDLTSVRIRQGRLVESESLLKDLEDSAKTPEQKIQVKQVRADLYLYQGRLQESIQLSEDLMRHWDETGSWLKLANTLNNLGAALSHRGLYYEAQRYFERSIQISEKIGDYSTTSRAYLFLGYTWFFLEENSKALDNFMKAKEYATKGLHNRQIYVARSGIAEMKMEMQEFDGLEEEIIFLIGEYEKMGDRSNRFAEITRRAKLSYLKGDQAEAIKRIEYALNQLAPTEHTTLKCTTNAQAAQIYLKAGNIEKAKEHYALSKLGEWNATHSNIVFFEAELALAVGDKETAIVEIQKAREKLGENWNSHHEKKARNLLKSL